MKFMSTIPKLKVQFRRARKKKNWVEKWRHWYNEI